MEERDCHKNRSFQGNIKEFTGGSYTRGRSNMLTGLERIQQLVEEHPKRKLQTVVHLINETTLKEVHKRQKTGKATGIDRITREIYEENIEENLEKLIRRMKTFQYHPQPVKRAFIPKNGTNEVRPLGIPAYEDKLVQGVIAEILDFIYEPKFYECSYGFRKGKGCHQAIKYLNDKLMIKSNWIVDVDIKGFFTQVDHEWMMKFLEHEIEDKNFLRYIKRFLKAGIMENGQYEGTEEGMPQGGSCSPVMANVYLHYVVDTWFAIKIKRQCRGKAEMVRYADDMVFSFEYDREAKEFYTALRERLKKFGLELAEEKSKILPFGRFAGKTAGTFDFLGFTTISGKSRKGKYMVKFQTSEKKLKVKRKEIKEWLKQNMHEPPMKTIKKLNVKLQGHYNYYGISHNMKKMRKYYEYVVRELFRVLRRRSQRKKLNWEKFNKILAYNPIKKPTITYPLWSYKSERIL